MTRTRTSPESGMGNASPDTETDAVPADVLRRHQFAYLVDAMPLMTAVTLVGVASVLFVFRDSSDPLILYGWAAALVVPTLLGFLRYLSKRGRPLPQTVSRSSIDKSLVRTVAAGILWGLAEWTLSANASSTQHMFLAFVLAGMASGVIVLLYPLPLHCIGFSLAAAPGGIQCMLRGSTETELAVGILLLLYLAVVSVVAVQGFRRFRGAIADKLALEKSRRLLVDAIEAADEAFAIFDDKGRRRFANRRFEETFSADIQFNEALDEPIVEQMPDGREFRLSVRPTAEGGLVAVASDITLMKRTRRALEASNRVKTEFLAVMSHELKTPLNGVIGFAELIGMEAAQRNLPTLRDYAICILDSGKRLHRLVCDILLLSDIESGRYEPREGSDTLARCVVRALERLVDKADGGPAIRVEVPDDIEIDLDIRALEKILACLLENAVKFTPPGGEVAISARAREDGVELAVADSGCGIEPDRLAGIFEVFTQADGSSRRSHEGAGLGLAIARTLARRLGGDVAISSTPGAGTEARLHLPAACLAARAATRADMQDPDTCRNHISSC